MTSSKKKKNDIKVLIAWLQEFKKRIVLNERGYGKVYEYRPKVK